jgi:putative endonuclease
MSGWTYIMASRPYGTLYVGVTNDIGRRAWEHREGLGSAFCKMYGVTRLVYVQHFEDITRAIAREKRMKKWPRTWKINAIEEQNPRWDDLFERINTDGLWAPLR